MKFIAKAMLVLFFAVSGVLVSGTVITTSKATALDGPSHRIAQAKNPNQNQPTNQPITYSYTTQPDDTYTYIARKAVQTYGKKANVQLTQAQIIYAETQLTLEAGSPRLDVGQKVELKESAVKQWVDKAKTLSPEEAAAWEYYVPYVDFNTNEVGNPTQ